jgi:hypothetical protein
MTEMLVRAPAFTFPDPVKPHSTLLDVASVQEGIGFMEPQGLAESYNCMILDATPVWPCPTTPSPKSFSDAPVWVDGIRFAVYGGIKCKGPGFSMEGGEDKARQAFLAGESVGVERALMTQRFTTALGTTNVTPTGGAVNPALGLSILESHAACLYVGAPIIHMSRGMASLLAGPGYLVEVGGHLETKMGSKIAAGGGYGCPNKGPSGANAAQDTNWMYASGAVAVARGDLLVASDIDRTTNDIFILVERAYVAAVDCYTAAINVKIER